MEEQERACTYGDIKPGPKALHKFLYNIIVIYSTATDTNNYTNINWLLKEGNDQYIIMCVVVDDRVIQICESKY